MSQATYLEFCAATAIYAFDPIFEENTGLPRAVSVVNSMSLDFLSVGVVGQLINLETKIIKINKSSAVCEVSISDQKTGRYLSKATINKVFLPSHGHIISSMAKL